ncbi:hypothetical protein [Enterobacter ludwigii]|uniref:hypothetical protein n=1 Tax=Enterobacter ludwigii TaxID=299767 RepID=UPI00242D7AB1|nr:hypothetical protein [Enterobacter ludwigii]WGC27255.1 hypothetical protein NFL62_02500 [Enterobacter ludwigii]
MQVHDLPQGAPVLALAGEFSVGKTHAKPCTLCMHGFFTGKQRDFLEFLKGLLSGQLCTAAGVIQVLCRCEFFTIIIA